MRGDDIAGSILARSLIKLFSNREEIIVFDGGTVPENYTSAIKKENPSHIILIDAADLRKKPGSIKIIKKDEIAQYNISTHAMPLSYFITYLQHYIPAQIILIGIQPKTTEIAHEVSEEVKNSIESLLFLFKNLA